ncbi:hypothetical protein JGZ30_04925 [Staphylococcus pseudintermedius]|uniref:hypothetical protein n=1 Tax=Staphylococcus pseudintermedius TaxID=283734 RepID=UPI00056CE0CB|nr:hypothetical protein [Staphylococcus pseudintermedius]EGQ0366559.1 hypothetical protein [Staphylococcus pseudintermedius]EGQ1765330.1 hypothetical protein [Staphylococcus pseudintermedius]EGQ2923515.1 hypothetical protein [Staphylococcus pseudintermedius]EGQ3075594.1 hypothetical protein [Staphylococcus pseudintermedius]EGQ3092896.1 hypothetical protein [Staphylococcus pseudintermedius]
MNEEQKQKFLTILNDSNYRMTIANLLIIAMEERDSNFNRSVGYLINSLKENNRPTEEAKTQSILPTLLSILAMTMSIVAVVLQILN